ncbi:MAG: nickel pincer cofactor biosynthesis protein LarB [Planctomycetia bacterium]|nr:nickel pincer cofactor biosynthesis protein LarB [Planctomycetia bacterium]
MKQGEDTSVDKNCEFDLDVEREERCGFPEVVYGQGKEVASIIRIFHRQLEQGQPCFATRVSAAKAKALQTEFAQGLDNRLARTFRIESPHAGAKVGKVAVLTAGTSDAPVAEEAMETLAWAGVNALLIQDVGVAGPERLRKRVHQFADADAVIVVAGMEGALPSVVGGYVAVPVIAVPTSVGYGASLGGMAAMLGMLNSCASNVCVVNIDAGFKGGYLAALIAKNRHK